MKSDRKIATTFGLLFILSFISYGLGSGLIESVINEKSDLSFIYKNQNLVIIGVVLIAIVHTLANILMISTILPIFKKYNENFQMAYFGFSTISTIIVTVGSIFILSIVTISEIATNNELENLNNLMQIFKKTNFYFYQIGMTIWGFGGLALCYLIKLSKLIPNWLVLSGFIGYLIFISGTILELFGVSYGTILSIPGGIFELVLSIRLIIKGFDFVENNSNS